MAKVSFNKLGLVKTIEPKIVEFNGMEIEVKQYLPVNDKLELISNIINASADDNNFANPVKIDIFTTLEILYNYTNINFTDKQKEDPAKLYDLVISNGLVATVAKAIPGAEYKGVYDNVKACVNAVYAYRNSVLGILESAVADYSSMNLDATNIYNKLADPENMDLIKQVLTKLG